MKAGKIFISFFSASDTSCIAIEKVLQGIGTFCR